MRSRILIVIVCLLAVTTTFAQKKWEELNDEQKLTQLKSFRDDNQKYLKDTLKLTPTQMADLDNVNICFLSTLDRVDRYGKDQAKKEQYAEALWQVRWAQVDAIMGKEKHEKYATYIKKKLTAALNQKQI